MGRSRPSLATGLAGRDNALNFLRLVLASMVLIGHTYILGGFGTSPFIDLSGLAVNGFFTLSGYLIAGSRMGLKPGPYLLRRCARILPAYWLCLLVTAFAFAPLAARHTGVAFRTDPALHYVTDNWYLRIHTWAIDGLLAGNPYPKVWNGSLWTLEFEFLGYLGAGALLTIPWARRYAGRTLVALLVTYAGLQVLAMGPLTLATYYPRFVLRLGGFFLAGMVLWAGRNRVPARWDLGLLSAGCVIASYLWLDQRLIDALTPLPLAYLLLWLGGALPVRLGARNDISYGVYIYAFPLQQLLAAYGGHRFGAPAFAAIAMVLTIIAATISWFGVERPVLRLVHRRPAPARGRAG